jgi:hypothetical protein
MNCGRTTRAPDLVLVALRQLWLPYGNRAFLHAAAGVLMIFEVRAGVKENVPPFSTAGGARPVGPRGEPVLYSLRSQLASSFPARRPGLPQTTLPARAAVWFVPVAESLAAIKLWRHGPHWPRENGSFARRH